MQEPIEVRLRDSKQIALARLQDMIVEAAMEVEPKIILHGGTAIWRCYNGNRFSEDVDIYATDTQVKGLNQLLTWALSKRGARMEYPIYTNHVIGVTSDDARSKLEAMKLPRGIKPAQVEYTRASGSKMFVNTLSVQDFIAEKANTYIKRRYIRDLYDLYHLVTIEKPDKATGRLLRRFINGVEKPIDESKLKDLVYMGIAPSFDTMITTIKKMIG